MVGETGLEPARLAPRDPKSRVSAISPLAHEAQPSNQRPYPLNFVGPTLLLKRQMHVNYSLEVQVNRTGRICQSTTS